MAIGLQFPMEGEHLILNPYFPRLLVALSAEATQHGYSFVLLPAHRSAEFPLEPLLDTQRLDAAILVDPSSTNDVLPLLRRYRVPLVTVGRHLGRGRTHWVDNDTRATMGLVLDHLAQQGFTRPALISLGSERYSYIADLEDGYRSGLAATDQAARIVRAPDLTERAGYDAAITLLARRDRPDAIIAAVDRQAIGVLAAAEELGIDVPGSLGVVGEGDTVLAGNAHPPLSSVDPRPAELGRAAFGLVQRVLDGTDGDFLNEVVPCVLVTRESSVRATSIPGSIASRARPSSG
jgi:DNA-binding LacI/PurR family transcriptional regulator